MTATILLAVVAVLAIAAVILLDRRNVSRVDQLLDRHDSERQRWEDERRELLNRFTHPERMPIGRARPPVIPPTGANGQGDVDQARKRAMAAVGRTQPIMPGLPTDRDDLPE